MLAVADLVESYGRDIRLTRQQNLIVTGVADVEATLGARRARLPGRRERVCANSIGCTGEPHCNFAVGETKGRLGTLIEHLETTFGDEVAELRLHLDGCPHACGQHWVGDLGFQGTTGRTPRASAHQGYDILLRGALGPVPRDRRPVFRRVPSEDRARGRRPDPRLARRPHRRRELPASCDRRPTTSSAHSPASSLRSKRVREEEAA